MAASSSLDPFDYSGIRQSCWLTCDGSEVPPEYLPHSLPVYRDDSTRDQFVSVATFFGCLDNCEGQYDSKRITFIIPMVLIGLTVIGSVLSCWLCKGCLLYKACHRKRQSGLLDSSSSSLGNLASLSSSSASSASMDSANKLAQSSGAFSISTSSLYPPLVHSTGRRKRGRKVNDLGDSIKSNSSMNNSWMPSNNNKSNGEDNKTARILKTASKLGRKLIVLDKDVDDKVKTIKKNNIPKSKNRF